jgi:L-lactate dehydrogenase complex protein LldG
VTEKEKILARIREALKVPAPVPGSHGKHHGEQQAPLSEPASSSNSRQWLPRVGQSFEERLALFQKNASDLKAEFHLLQNAAGCCAMLEKLRDAEGWCRIGMHAGQITEPICAGLGLPIFRTDQPYDVNALEQCDAGITECDALIAQTGSVLVTSRSAGGRALSVLPPHHVVLARREQLLGDLQDGLELLKKKYSSNYPSFISFITGPSRTGDIERVLVLGAHGPKKLTILCF